MNPQASQSTTANSADSSLGEIAWRNVESGASGRCLIQSAKCIIGSSNTADIVLPEPVAHHHVILTFGKRFTLLKAPESVQVGDRFVKEWLIDEPTEVSIDDWRITILPARCSKSLATVIPPHAIGDVLNPDPLPSAPSLPPPTPPTNAPQPAAYMGDWTSEVNLTERHSSEPLPHATPEHTADLAALDAQRLEQVRHNLDKERQEYERLARERLEHERLEHERLEHERLEHERLEHERLEQEQFEHEQIAAERNESRLRAIELSIEQLRDGFDSMRDTIAAGSEANASLRSTFQEQLNQLSSQLAVDFQHQLTAQLEQRDSHWNHAVSKNLESIESHISALGNRIEDLSQQVTTSDPADQDRGPSELSSALFASLSGLEERLENIIGRMDEISLVTSDNAQKIAGWGDDSSNSIRAVEDVASRLLSDRVELENAIEHLRAEMQHVTATSQENYEYVLSHIQNFQMQMASAADEEIALRSSESDASDIHPSGDVEGRLSQVLAAELTRQSDTHESSFAHRTEFRTEQTEFRTEQVDELVQEQVASPAQDRESYESPDVASVLSQYGFDVDDKLNADEESYSTEKKPNVNETYRIQEEPTYEAPEYPEFPPSVPHSYASSGQRNQEDDESIEAYMQQLLQRVKGGVEQSSTLEIEPAKSVVRTRADFLNNTRQGTQTDSLVSTKAPEGKQEFKVLTPEEFMPRNQAPERPNDLNIFRELANNNARRAITTSDSKRTNSALLFKGAIVVVALTVGSIILMISPLGTIPSTLGVLSSFAVAVIWGYDCLINLRRLGRNRTIIRN